MQITYSLNVMKIIPWKRIKEVSIAFEIINKKTKKQKKQKKKKKKKKKKKTEFTEYFEE